MKKLFFKLPNYLGLEHIALEAIDSAKRAEKNAVTTKTIISIINSTELMELTGNSTLISNGAIYGTLSRLRGKDFLKKVLLTENGTDELAYQLTGKGQEALNNIRKKTLKAINGFPEYIPLLLGI